MKYKVYILDNIPTLFNWLWWSMSHSYDCRKVLITNVVVQLLDWTSVYALRITSDYDGGTAWIEPAPHRVILFVCYLDRLEKRGVPRDPASSFALPRSLSTLSCQIQLWCSTVRLIVLFTWLVLLDEYLVSFFYGQWFNIPLVVGMSVHLCFRCTIAMSYFNVNVACLLI